MKRPLVFLDADVLFAGVAAPTEHGASHIVLRLGEITLIECVASTQVVTEVERNFKQKLPSKLPELRLIISRSLRVVPDPKPHGPPRIKGRLIPKTCRSWSRLSRMAVAICLRSISAITNPSHPRLWSNVRVISSQLFEPSWFNWRQRPKRCSVELAVIGLHREPAEPEPAPVAWSPHRGRGESS